MRSAHAQLSGLHVTLKLHPRTCTRFTRRCGSVGVRVLYLVGNGQELDTRAGPRYLVVQVHAAALDSLSSLWLEIPVLGVSKHVCEALRRSACGGCRATRSGMCLLCCCAAERFLWRFVLCEEHIKRQGLGRHCEMRGSR